MRTEVTEGSIRQKLIQLKRNREEPLSASDLEKAKRQINGRFAVVVVFEGKVLCALPVGVVNSSELAYVAMASAG